MKILAFCRMQPPTIGHKAIVDTVARLSDEYGVKGQIFLSPTKNDRNPLPFNLKLQICNALFGPGVISNKVYSDLIDVFVKHSDPDEDLIFVAGSDRVEEYCRVFDRFNGNLYEYRSFQVVSAGERSKNIDGEVNVASISGSLMRTWVKRGEKEKFLEGIPTEDLRISKYIWETMRSLTP